MSKTLLLVDDDTTFTRIAARALGRHGFTVRIAHTIAEALAQLDDSVGYAVVDLSLGSESGLALVPRLREARAEMRILILTGYASIATAVEGIKLGADNYLAKPADVDAVVKALTRDEADPALAAPTSDPLSLDRMAWEHIQRVLAEHEGNISATARALKMHRRTLQRKLGKRPVKA